MFWGFLVDSIKQKVIIMKNNVLLICVCLFIFSCTNNSKEENNSPMFSFESTGGVGLGNKKIYIQENDTSYHISEIWDGMENFFTGFHYFYLNESCYHYLEDSVDQSFMSFGSLDEGNKKIWVREVDSTYTFCVSKSDPHWTILENKETGKIVCEYKSMNNDSISISSELVDFYSKWFSKEKVNSEVSLCLKSNTLKHPDGIILSYDMYSMYNEKESRLRSGLGLGGKLTYDMVEVFNELPNYFNVGDTTQVVFQNIKINTEDGIKPGKPLVIEIIF